MRKTDWIVFRGGGDLATGAIQRLQRSGFSTIILESAEPLAIRRHVALCEAVYTGTWQVEDITARLAKSQEELEVILHANAVPVLVDPNGTIFESVQPAIVVDAIVAKRNLGTTRSLGRCGTIALGPGFIAGEDVDIVIETQRGHNLGRLIFQGQAAPNTGVPGAIAGFTAARVIHAPLGGRLKTIKQIGDYVEQGETIATIEGAAVPASISGILRGLLRDGINVKRGLKMADIDPRAEEKENCFTISDKSRSLGGSVLEAVLILRKRCYNANI